MKRLYRACVEFEFCFVADAAEYLSASRQYAREEAGNLTDLVTGVSVVRRTEDVPYEWRDGNQPRGCAVPLVYGADADYTAEGWIAANPYVPTDSELERAGQLNMLGAK